MKHKVLYDLSLGHKSVGFSGIPQDTRLLFAGLARSEELDLAGLVFGTHQDVFSFATGNNLEETSVFLGSYLDGSLKLANPSFISRAFNKALPHLYRLYVRYTVNKKSVFDLKPIDSKYFADLLWRNLFQQTIEPAEKSDVLQQKFFRTSMTLLRMSQSVLGGFSACQLDSRDYDFALFQDSRAVKLAPRTKKIIRYHDGIPVFHSDTATQQLHGVEHMRSIAACQHDSIYVCNSSSSRDDLATISPVAAEKARVIPYFLPKMQKQHTTYELLNDICTLRRSATTLPEHKHVEIDQWFNHQKAVPRFIMSLATIEPRKNYIGLIQAWSKLRYQTGQDIKLMIVGKPGWKYEETLKAMKPFVASGNLIHLEGVAQHELPYLYSAASCFVFPSFAEGFGLPPSEAMQCDCPVALSDIPAHRYSAGDAALYFSPYDIDDMVKKISQLLDANNKAMVDALIKAGHANVARYTVEAVLPQWEQMFDELKGGK